jgi:hypothetical protein
MPVVKSEDNGLWDALCPGEEAGDPACEFTSAGWGTRDQARDRLREHREEHESGEPMRELADFMEEAKNGGDRNN